MANSDELYPGLDTELDEAFRRHTGAEGLEATSTLEDVVTQHLPGQEALLSTDLESLREQLDKINEEIPQVVDVADLQALLDKKTKTIDEWMRQRTEALGEQIENASQSAEEKVVQDAEDARIFAEAREALREGRPNAAKDLISRKTSSPQAAQVMREALDALVGEQAEGNLNEGRPNAARSHIQENASSPDSAHKIREALDAIVLQQAEETLREGRPNAARGHIQQNASSTLAAECMREALDSIVLAQAEASVREGRPNGAKSHIGENATGVSKDKVLEVLGL